ncbi:MAG TPA: KTSC domain-containing protein [Fimbriimonadaceae bacterium]|nr:KTSC domain-containing protein [Fimbriimonadaceae bacterium]
MERIPVSSSLVVSAGYDLATQTMEIEFTSRSIYRYENVPQSVFEGLIRADSVGSYFNAHVRDDYPYSRIA